MTAFATAWLRVRRVRLLGAHARSDAVNETSDMDSFARAALRWTCKSPRQGLRILTSRRESALGVRVCVLVCALAPMLITAVPLAAPRQSNGEWLPRERALLARADLPDRVYACRPKSDLTRLLDLDTALGKVPKCVRLAASRRSCSLCVVVARLMRSIVE